MRQSYFILAAVILFACSDVAAQVTASSTDTPVTIVMGSGGAPLTSTISFPVSGTITNAIADLALNVGGCGSGALTLTGPGGSVTVMKSINANAGDIFALVDDTAFNSCGGDCLGGCGMAGAPEPCTPDLGTMATFIGQASDAADWTLSIETTSGVGCGPWTIHSWSLTLEGPPVSIFEDGFESGDVGAWSSSSGPSP